MFYEVNEVVTRKPHRCFGCNREFGKGTEMAYTSWVDAGKWNHEYFCSTCSELSCMYAGDDPSFEFCKGDLLEDALEYENRKNRKKDYIPREDALKAIYTSTAPALEVKAIPAADVVEVRHESWKDIGIMWIDKTNQPDGISTMFCPACERYATRIYYYGDPTDMMNYCPNCGAKMDGGQEDV